ncbi:hypothetical protein MMC07_000384 [Pseudocyphellaria aurata]|nr:hypothetical protein [Pseudocyphellaria aurata]
MLQNLVLATWPREWRGFKGYQPACKCKGADVVGMQPVRATGKSAVDAEMGDHGCQAIPRRRRSKATMQTINAQLLRAAASGNIKLLEHGINSGSIADRPQLLCALLMVAVAKGRGQAGACINPPFSSSIPAVFASSQQLHLSDIQAGVEVHTLAPLVPLAVKFLVQEGADPDESCNSSLYPSLAEHTDELLTGLKLAPGKAMASIFATLTPLQLATLAHRPQVFQLLTPTSRPTSAQPPCGCWIRQLVRFELFEQACALWHACQLPGRNGPGGVPTGFWEVPNFRSFGSMHVLAPDLLLMTVMMLQQLCLDVPTWVIREPISK